LVPGSKPCGYGIGVVQPFAVLGPEKYLYDWVKNIIPQHPIFTFDIQEFLPPAVSSISHLTKSQ